MSYVDGYLLVVKKKNLAAYRRLAMKAGKIWREHGALAVWENAGDDLDKPFGIPYGKLLKVKRDETVIFSWVVFKNRAARNKINKKVMEDSRFDDMDMKTMPFDMKRMSSGGFKPLVAL
jgi:uncharacterized protein YbaA (DUF1428 family)